ncbi:putative inositol-1-monophosphatase [Haladaptatus paucihalophilus DX253]|uniref:fructose-bisphosphatase n=1 Tax=Haladaptatus paucihalophilus DX253 TaxID=797209 RepID=E7QNP9_HALPU|nr:inositol monophosphatase [Haladaptatus paucihalophilus]EFW94166.1 putative inositol-1-monophosphatase [Haladaptatus paucihalophilus DX253]SHK59800.1 myo-inositol-1(or 4)-monophosphatase [Haladaptatus paucihalophilus DX253]
MDESDLDSFEAVAVRACDTAGGYLASEFETNSLAAEHGPDDVKALADRAAERRVLNVLTEAFPDHAIYAEESGKRSGAGEYRWVVDPLDGTNNFCSGIPYFGTALALLREDVPVLSVVRDPLHDDTYVARRGGGVTLNGEPIRAESDMASDHATVSFVLGLDAVRDEELRVKADALNDEVAERCKRVWESWAPALDWGLLARGKLEAVVSVHPDAVEQHAGWLLAEESGARLANDDDLFLAAASDETFETLRTLL